MTRRRKILYLGLTWLGLFALTFCGLWGWPVWVAWIPMVLTWVVAWFLSKAVFNRYIEGFGDD